MTVSDAPTNRRTARPVDRYGARMDLPDDATVAAARDRYAAAEAECRAALDAISEVSLALHVAGVSYPEVGRRTGTSASNARARVNLALARRGRSAAS